MIRQISISATSVKACLLILVITHLSGPSTGNAANEVFAEPFTITVSRSSLDVDGKLDEKIWQSLKVFKLKPSEMGVPAELGGEVRILLRGNYLCLGMFCPEPDGKVLAKSFGYNPVWEKDAYSSPEVEDRLVIVFSSRTAGGRNSELKLEINPWGALHLEQNNRLIPSTGIMTAADINLKGWTVETAVPLDELGVDNSSPGLKLSLVRVRSRRALAPEFRWSLEGPGKFMDLFIPHVADKRKKDDAPRFYPPVIGNTEPPLQVGRVQAAPDVKNNWDDPFWKSIPGFYLPKNESNPRKPDYPTEVKWVHDCKTLAVFFHCTEDERVDCDNGARDGNLGSDDTS